MQRFKCIICEKNIESIYFESLKSEHPESGMWDGGVVEILPMPYGSRLDGDVYIFGLCDDCIEQKYKEGLIGKRLEDYI